MNVTHSTNGRLKRRRKRLFHEQGGKCYWCRCQMVLPKGFIKYPPPNQATIDHLDDRFSELRGTLGGQERTVVACRKCNNKRGRESEMQAPIEELRRRSKNHKSARALTSVPAPTDGED